MSKDRPPLVHIGYHKTASSWLQARLWDEPALGFRLYPRTAFARMLVEPHPLAFDAGVVRERLAPWLEATRQRGLTPVFSHERLSGYPHSGGFDSREIADRLAAVFDEARIVVVIREQRAMILSNYRQYIRDGGASSLSRYLDPPQAGHRRVPGFAVEFFQYDRLLGLYRDRFGAENVCALVYEELRAEPGRFLGRIRDFAQTGASEQAYADLETAQVLNPALASLELRLLRWANRLFRASPLNPSPLLPSRVGFALAWRLARALGRLGSAAGHRDERERAIVAGLAEQAYGRSNAGVSGMVGVDLAAFGYAVEPARDLSE
jgi:hypothetical protein